MSYRSLALVNSDNIVENVLVMPTDEAEYNELLPKLEKDLSPLKLIECTDWEDSTGLHSHVGVGFTWDGSKFIGTPKGVDTITEEDLKRAEEMLKRDQELAAERLAQGLDAPAVAPGGTN